mmetsp:Transcript_35784/g.93630  ORF Transcript_35784/g.93630 Transcript_35784/m.93630 type:complete len:232 (-) Transcript_35784:734-1429(-)
MVRRMIRRSLGISCEPFLVASVHVALCARLPVEGPDRSVERPADRRSRQRQLDNCAGDRGPYLKRWEHIADGPTLRKLPSPAEPPPVVEEGWWCHHHVDVHRECPRCGRVTPRQVPEEVVWVHCTLRVISISITDSSGNHQGSHPALRRGTRDVAIKMNACCLDLGPGGRHGCNPETEPRVFRCSRGDRQMDGDPVCHRGAACEHRDRRNNSIEVACRSDQYGHRDRSAPR